MIIFFISSQKILNFKSQKQNINLIDIFLCKKKLRKKIQTIQQISILFFGQ